MNSHASVPQALALLRRYRDELESFARREEKLVSGHRSAVHLATRTHEQSMLARREKLETDVGQAEAEHAGGRRKATADFNRRERRLTRARHNAEAALRQTVEHRKGSRIVSLQRGGLDTQREQARRLAEAQEAAATLKSGLRKDREAFSRATGGAAFALLAWPLRSLAAVGVGGEKPAPRTGGDALGLHRQFTVSLAEARGRLLALDRNPLTWLLRLLPPWLVTLVAVGLGLGAFVPWPVLGGVVAVLWVLQLVAAGSVKREAEPLLAALAEARAQLPAILPAAEQEVETLRQQTAEAQQTGQAESAEAWQQALAEAESTLASGVDRLQAKWTRATARNEALYQTKLAQLETAHPPRVARLQTAADTELAAMESAWDTDRTAREAAYAADWQALERDFQATILPLWREIDALRQTAHEWFPAWTPQVLADARARAPYAQAAPIGRLDVDLSTLAAALPQDPRLALPGPVQFDLPLTLAFPRNGSVVFETSQSGREAALAALNDTVFRLLATVPPAQLSFTLVDPTGLGSSFASLAHLADYEGGLVTSRIWTQKAQIEQRLTDLNEHVEKVIQMYLRNDCATIAEYNEQAGNIAERYHFLVIADFPSNFSDQALRQLQNLVTGGPRCGVFTLMHWDTRLPMHDSPLPDELRAASVRVVEKGGALVLADGFEKGATLATDQPPVGEAATDFLHRTGKLGRDAARVEVPFSHVAPPDDKLWQESTASEVRVPIGRTGASKLQYLELGQGTRQHALFAGKTGSGKSNLFHVIIANLALHCSPAEVEFYLVDFKKGVEFKCYATHKLPHARVVAIESDREFGLSVLQRVDEELRRRGDLFRKLGVQDMAGYRRASGKPLPRSLLVIDEFQEFFTEDDRVAQTASVLLDRIVRQGRAFGIHVLLGSQTLGGAYSLARATLGQMVVRVALQCNEADALLIMDDGNSAARLLTRPGEGIYNDSAGALEGNSPFQAVFVPEQVRDEALEKVAAMAAAHPVAEFGPPVVFEGNAPAEIADNEPFRVALAHEPAEPPAEPRIWLGAPNSIKGPTEAVFRRQSGNHLLVIGQRDEAAVTMVGTGLIALAAQHPAGTARLILADSTAPGTSERAFFDEVLAALPRRAEVARGEDLLTLVGELSGELTRRIASSGEEPPVFLFVHGLQKARKIRFDEDLAYGGDENHPAMQFDRLIKEGSSHGIHLVATIDTYNNLQRFLSRKALAEFEMRVLFQMSANDSSSLVDSPVAGTLGLNRALFHHEHEGYQEVFRPYGPPSSGWLEEAAAHLARRPAPAPTPRPETAPAVEP